MDIHGLTALLRCLQAPQCLQLDLNVLHTLQCPGFHPDPFFNQIKSRRKGMETTNRMSAKIWNRWKNGLIHAIRCPHILQLIAYPHSAEQINY